MAETNDICSMHVEEGGYPKRFKDAPIIHLYKLKGNPQVCDNHSHRGNSLINSWKDTGKKSFESPECASLSGCTYTRKSVWVQEKTEEHRHYLNSKTTSREMARAKDGPLHDL